MTKNRRSTKLRMLSSVTFVSFWLYYCNGTEDAFFCSEASSHINSCCGRLVIIICEEESTQDVYIPPQNYLGCGDHSYKITPAELSSELSRCIIEKTCNDIVGAGICDLGSLRTGQQCSSTSTDTACQAFSRLSCPR